MNQIKKISLNEHQQKLIELMQGINFGRIEDLTVRNGESGFDPPPQVVREIKFGEENGPRQEVSAEDFALKSQAAELFAQLDCLGSGTVLSLDIKHCHLSA